MEAILEIHDTRQHERHLKICEHVMYSVETKISC